LPEQIEVTHKKTMDIKDFPKTFTKCRHL